MLESDAVVATGTIYVGQNSKENEQTLQSVWHNIEIEDKGFPIKEEDIYQELSLKGYNYK